MSSPEDIKKHLALRRLQLPISAARTAIGIWAALYTYNFVRINWFAPIMEWERRQYIYFQAAGAIVFWALYLLSRPYPYVIFLIAAIITAVDSAWAIIAMFPLAGLSELLVMLVNLILVLAIVYGLLYARAYQALRRDIAGPPL